MIHTIQNGPPNGAEMCVQIKDNKLFNSRYQGSCNSGMLSQIAFHFGTFFHERKLQMQWNKWCESFISAIGLCLVLDCFWLVIGMEFCYGARFWLVDVACWADKFAVEVRSLSWISGLHWICTGSVLFYFIFGF